MRLGTKHILISILPLFAMGVGGVLAILGTLDFQRSKLDEAIHHDADLAALRLDEFIENLAKMTDELAHRHENLDAAADRIQFSAVADFFNSYASQARVKIMLNDLNHQAVYRSWEPLSAKDTIPLEQQGVFGGKVIQIQGKPHFAMTNDVVTNDGKVIGQLLVAFNVDETFLKSIILKSNDSIQIGIGSSVLGSTGLFDANMQTGRSSSKLLPTMWVEIRRDVSAIQARGRLSVAVMAFIVLFLSGSSMIYQWRSTSHEIIDPIQKIYSVIIEGANADAIGALPKNDIGQLAAALFKQKAELEQKIAIIRSITEQLHKDSSLLKVLSHDIANPLTAIKGVTSILQKKTPSEDLAAQDLIQRLSLQVAKVEQLLTHVREMKALESGKHRLDLREVLFGAVMTDIQESFQERLAAKGITLHWNKGDAGVTFVAEPISFRVSVFSNLISNAIKFSPRDGRIEVSCSELNGNTRIEIRDYGHGVPLAIRGQLFSSNHETTRLGTEGESGTGFGMPIVKFYIDLYGGKINFSTKLKSDSETDHGTIFLIQLPTKRRLAQNQLADVKQIPVTVPV